MCLCVCVCLNMWLKNDMSMSKLTPSRKWVLTKPIMRLFHMRGTLHLIISPDLNLWVSFIVQYGNLLCILNGASHLKMSNVHHSHSFDKLKTNKHSCSLADYYGFYSNNFEIVFWLSLCVCLSSLKSELLFIKSIKIVSFIKIRSIF